MATPATGPSTAIDAAIDAQHPWLGLASFTEETRGYFYGRETEVSELTRRVQRKLLTVLFGQSGLGKTSILNAGVVPRLRQEGYCPVYVRVDYGAAAPSPAEQIKQAVFRATGAAGHWTRPGAAEQGESLWEFLHHRDDELRDAEGKPVIPLLIFDQFEEIFTLAQADDAGRARAAGFIADLADLVENRPPKALEARIESDDTLAERFDFARADYRVLIALREDYLAHLESLKASMPSITQNRMRLARMTGEQALEAVLKPGGRLVTPEVAESIVRFVAGGAELRNAEVEPSLLSLICRELNNARLAQGKDTISIDVLAGSNATILGEFYERALADQPAALRKVIEDQLLTDSGYRENIAEERVLKAFTAAGATPDAATALATLVNRRLLRIEERLDVRRVELTHDVLCSVVQASRAERLEREAREDAERKLAAQREHERATRAALVRARRIAVGCAALAVLAVAGAAYGIYSAQRTAKAEQVAQRSRDEAERLVDFILDDFYNEMEPIGRLDVLAGLAKRAVDYYDGLPLEAQNASTRRNSAIARAQYSRVLRISGQLAEADRYLLAATTLIAEVRKSGDASDATVIASARIDGLRVAQLSTRRDFKASIALGLQALQRLQPVLDKPDAPRAARQTEGAILQTTGFSQLRDIQRPAAAVTLRRALAVFRGLGATELGDLVAATGYIRTSWLLEEAIRRTGSVAERRSLLEEGVALADRLLAVRPGHRPALRAKATTLTGLSQIAQQEEMQVAKALQSLTAAIDADTQALSLDAGSGASRNNVRIRYGDRSDLLLMIGRLDEARRDAELGLEVGQDEGVDSFGKFNLAFANFQTGVFYAELGEDARADALQREGDRLVEDLKRDGGSDLAALAIRRAMAAGRIALARRDRAALLVARRDLDAAKARFLADNPGDPAVDGLASVASAASAAVALALGDAAAAEGYARQSIEESKRFGVSGYYERRDDATVLAMLSLALSAQGKWAEASEAIRPALAFHLEPLVRASDDQMLKADHARVLYAAALASTDPARRRAYLVEAAQRFDSMAAPLRQLKSFAALRADIARALQG